MTKRDALRQLENELKKLLQTAKPEDAATLSSEMGRFTELFGRFLQKAGPAFDWDKLQKLPPDAIKDYSNLKVQTNDDQVS